MTPMTDDEMVLELRREAGYLRTRTGHHQRPVMAEVHDQIADRLHALSDDASLGALVRRIREVKPMAYLSWPESDAFKFAASESGLSAALDSLLPKEPEVAPSGWTYERADKFVRQIDHEGGTLVVRRADSDAVPPCDREFVAKLMEASRAH